MYVIDVARSDQPAATASRTASGVTSSGGIRTPRQPRCRAARERVVLIGLTPTAFYRAISRSVASIACGVTVGSTYALGYRAYLSRYSWLIASWSASAGSSNVTTRSTSPVRIRPAWLAVTELNHTLSRPRTDRT